MRIYGRTLIAGTVLAASAAHAAPITFDLTDPDSRNGIYNSTYAKQYNYANDGLGLSVTGWSYGTQTTTTSRCALSFRGRCVYSQTVTTTSVKEEIEQEYVGRWEGLGIEKTDSPNHAVDNEDKDYDMHLLSFDQLVKLTALDIGWYEGDTDISILAFTGDPSNIGSLTGKKWEELLGTGWSVVGNYYNVDTNGNSGAVNFNGVYSQYWLVGAYNSVFGGFSGPNSNKNKKESDDYYKLRGITAEIAPPPPPPPVIEVPEPGTALLFGAGLLGLVLKRRRRFV